MAQLIWVKPGNDDGRVKLFESSPLHPGGEAFVAGPPVQVALTPMVERKLAAGDLVQCDPPKPPEEEKPVHKTREEVQAEIARARGDTVPAPAPKPAPAPAKKPTGKPPKGDG